MCEGVLEMKTFGEEGKSGFSVNMERHTLSPPLSPPLSPSLLQQESLGKWREVNGGKPSEKV